MWLQAYADRVAGVCGSGCRLQARLGDVPRHHMRVRGAPPWVHLVRVRVRARVRVRVRVRVSMMTRPRRSTLGPPGVSTKVVLALVAPHTRYRPSLLYEYEHE